ncbi:hypothetical protein RGC27_08070, partial [Helicobacter pylori]|uniref:hypothetical protein n=1 Tax=Helicobacter pylori TaxID=210 RepID=UPI0029289B65
AYAGQGALNNFPRPYRLVENSERGAVIAERDGRLAGLNYPKKREFASLSKFPGFARPKGELSGGFFCLRCR